MLRVFDITGKVDQSGLRTHSCSVDMITSQINSFITPKRCYSMLVATMDGGRGGTERGEIAEKGH